MAGYSATPWRGRWTAVTPMEQTLANSVAVVEELVRALSSSEGDDQPAAALATRMKHAASHVDDITAQIVAKALIGDLCNDPLDLRRIEALLVLGMAHPELLRRHGIDVRREGERLALLWERQGQATRASAFRQTIDARFPAAPLPAAVRVDEAADAQPGARAETHEAAPPAPRAEAAARQLAAQRASRSVQIESLLREAGESIAAGRTREAVRTLQSVLAVDPTRKDVARMIRDIHYEGLQRKRHARRVAVACCAAFVLLAAGFGVLRREEAVQAEWAGLPAAADEDLATLELRRAAVDGLLDSRKAWFGMGEALRERAELDRRIAAVHGAADQARLQAEEELRERRAQAALLRDRARLAAERGDFAEAREGFSQALSTADQDWEHRARTERDAAAVDNWLAARRKNGDGNR